MFLHHLVPRPTGRRHNRVKSLGVSRPPHKQTLHGANQGGFVLDSIPPSIYRSSVECQLSDHPASLTRTKQQVFLHATTTLTPVSSHSLR